ncbi:hypothetical protein ACJJH9_02970 [Microbulbifer sp. DLAB2-AF]|uniref:hypothetical protein n=1 Tax=Microbulbifer sp. DLAB2-AF TaxID=3243395 RepID=UPI00403978B6
MRKIQLTLFIALSIPSLSNAYPVSLFDAEQSCQARDTTTGVRYIPPCDFTPQTLLPAQEKVTIENSNLLEGSFKSALSFSFSCETLRPLSIAYIATDDDAELIISDAPAKKSEEDFFLSFNHQYDGAKFSTRELVGATGFQAIKPGCELIVNDFISYPDPEYYHLLSSSLINVDKLLKNIFSLTNPSMDYVTSLGLIDNSLLMLSFLRPQADWLTRFMIDQTTFGLIEAKNTLTQDCGADSNTRLCTSAISNTRDAIYQESIKNEKNIIILSKYIKAQVDWLGYQSIDVENDRQKLEATLNDLADQLQI